MSQEFLLKTPIVPASPKVETIRGAEQAKKPENTDETSFSSALDKQIEQNDIPEKDPIEKTQASISQPEEDQTENTLKDENGKSLPENVQADDDNASIEIIDITDLSDTDPDASIITELKAEVTTVSKTKIVSAEQLIAEKTVIDKKPTGQPSLNKDKTNLFSGGSNSDDIIKTDTTVNGLELDKKPQTMNLRSDIFHALSKNKSPGMLLVDDGVTKIASDKTPERSTAGFSSVLTSASTIHSTPGQNIATTQPMLAVQPAMQSSAWNQVLSSRVVWMAREGIQEASLKLNPANLGPVEVKLNMHSDQANVLFISHNAATRDALEQALPRLRESFEQNGMQLADADVTGQESGQAEDEQTSETGVHHSNGQVAQIATEDDQQAESVEQDIEVGLSVYA
jgi:flagellar hook-length control protein FliK